jgi:hypothetical protein
MHFFLNVQLLPERMFLYKHSQEVEIFDFPVLNS